MPHISLAFIKLHDGLAASSEVSVSPKIQPWLLSPTSPHSRRVNPGPAQGQLLRTATPGSEATLLGRVGCTPRAKSEEVCGHPRRGPGGGVTQNECLVPIPACQSPHALQLILKAGYRARLVRPGLLGRNVNPQHVEQPLRAPVTSLTGLGWQLDMCGRLAGFQSLLSRSHAGSFLWVAKGLGESFYRNVGRVLCICFLPHPSL